jgi:hypothetical protein
LEYIQVPAQRSRLELVAAQSGSVELAAWRIRITIR